MDLLQYAKCMILSSSHVFIKQLVHGHYISQSLKLNSGSAYTVCALPQKIFIPGCYHLDVSWAPAKEEEIGNSMFKWWVTPFQQVLCVLNWELWSSQLLAGEEVQKGLLQASGLHWTTVWRQYQLENRIFNLTCSVALKRVGVGF